MSLCLYTVSHMSKNHNSPSLSLSPHRAWQRKSGSWNDSKHAIKSLLWNVSVPTLLTYSELVGGGEIRKYEAQSRNSIENKDFCSHYHSRFLLLSASYP